MNSVGRLILMAVLGGVLVAAMTLPVVASTGILARNTADSFTTLSVDSSGLPQRSAIYDADGKLLTYVYGVDFGSGMKYTGIDRQPVAYKQISKNMLVAIVAIEDNRFWQHGALDIKGTIRALVNNLENKPIQGGSTLEQQYVKNVILLQGLNDPAVFKEATAKTLSRKLNQLRMAVKVAHTMSKQQILAGYLNDSYYGSGAYGIEAAAETYFHTTAAKLTMAQAAMLAGIVENPTQYDPFNHPATAVERRNTVLARIVQTNPTALSAADAAKLEQEKLGLHPGVAENGCIASRVGNAGFFCDYVMHTLLLDKHLGKTTEQRAKLLATGGLRIYTTLSPKDQAAATKAVNWVLPMHSKTYNPSGNANTEVLIQPGTGEVRAIAENRQYGIGKGQTEVDYAVNTPYGGGAGVQTGSSSKLFTLITALEQNIPFGFQLTVPGKDAVKGYYDCQGRPTSVFNVQNDAPGTGTYSLYTATTQSVNVFFAHLEQKVGLCNTVKTAAKLGLTRADGRSLFKSDHGQPPADALPTFTLGVVDVSPMSMAAAYAVPASNGIYCKPIALTKIVTGDNKTLPVPSAGCHRVISTHVAEAANYILRGVLINGTAGGSGLAGYQAAGKTGTTNSATRSGTPYAAFAGYTTNLVGYVSVFNPLFPEKYPMAYQSACYRMEYGGVSCPSQMWGASAPLSTWHMSFDHAYLKGSHAFAQLPRSSSLWSKGDGQVVKQPKKKSSKKSSNSGSTGSGSGSTGGGSTGSGSGGTGGGGTGGGSTGGGGTGG